MEELHKTEKVILASRGDRIVNYLIDFILCIIIGSLIALILGTFNINLYCDSLTDLFLMRASYLLYFLPQEALFGRTLAKLITSTKAINKNGKNLSFTQALGRSICRVIPLEELSFLGKSKTPQGLHDILPGTMVIKTKSILTLT